MPQNINDPGRPSDLGVSRRQADAPGYVDWTKDVHPWMDEAACLAYDGRDSPDWFVNEDGRPALTQQRCKDICADVCPVRAECLKRALSLRPSDTDIGIWAGLTPRQLNRLRIMQTQVAA